ncbi:MAG TPA: hypothetical protein VMF69_23005 [Gemmataceae bacterium]|nr:hypothetical protein [Gemmataceae bacterium]
MRYVFLFAVSLSTVSLILAAARIAEDLTTITLNGHDCGPDGTATSEAGKELNRLKNRFHIPSEEDIDAEVSLAAMLSPGNDINRFDAKRAARIQGLVVNVMLGGNKETCNCKASAANERDTHIELALAKGAPSTQRVIVEVTPRIRILRGGEWTTAALRKQWKGKWVEVTGWLLFDSMHVDGAENTNPGGERNWRATCWEVHPVTDIKPLDSPPPTSDDFQPKTLTSLHRLHAAHVARSANGREAIVKRNKKYLDKFDKEELEEKDEEAKERGSKK